MTTIPFAELLAQWDGIMIEIPQEPIKSDILIASYSNYLTTILLVLRCAFVFSCVIGQDGEHRWR